MAQSETILDFLKQTEDYCYKEVAKNTNLILGKNKTAGLSTGLFLKLPIDVKVEKVDNPLPKLNKDLSTFFGRFTAYVTLGDVTKVNFVFMYHEEKDLRATERELKRHGAFLAFVYMHELQHIVRKHNTKSYETMMTRIASNVKDPYQLINIAEDYAINYAIKDLMLLDTTLKAKWTEIESCVCYDSKYHTDKLSDIDTLKDLIEQGKEATSEQLSATTEKVSFEGKDSLQPIEGAGEDSSNEEGEEGEGSGGKLDKTSTTQDDLDNAMSDLSESIQDLIKSQTKGTKAGELIEELFSSIKVETGWFKKIKASFKRQVYYMTHDYTTSWSNLNNTYRRIYKAPKKQFIDNKLEIVLSVDHSGSVGTEALQRLLYLMEDSSKYITKLTVLIHDTRIVKEFTIEDDFDIANNPQFKEALATRFVVGGTSHSDIFTWLTANIKTLDKSIYISYSDNYSDIPQEWAKNPKLRNLTTYFVCTENNPMEVPGAKDISLV
jgi:hypothetical protein